MSTKVEYTLVLQVIDDDHPPEIKLRRALKYALRACGLRCWRCVEGDGLQRVKPPESELGKRQRNAGKSDTESECCERGSPGMTGVAGVGVAQGVAK